MNKGLSKWMDFKAPTPRRAKLEDVAPLFNTLQRVRKLQGIREKFTNVNVEYEGPYMENSEEWVLVVEVKKVGTQFFIKAIPLRTTEKYTAVRRVYGWGLRDRDGNLRYTPEVL